MGHLPEKLKLHEWRKGEPLRASDLNFNFALVHGWAEHNAARAMPLVAGAELLREVQRLRAEVAELRQKLESKQE